MELPPYLAARTAPGSASAPVTVPQAVLSNVLTTPPRAPSRLPPLTSVAEPNGTPEQQQQSMRPLRQHAPPPLQQVPSRDWVSVGSPNTAVASAAAAGGGNAPRQLQLEKRAVETPSADYSDPSPSEMPRLVATTAETGTHADDEPSFGP